jgi:hypothetical protein
MKSLKLLGLSLVSFSISISAHALTKTNQYTTANYKKGASTATLSFNQFGKNKKTPETSRKVVPAEMKYKADKRKLKNDVKEMAQDRRELTKAKQQFKQDIKKSKPKTNWLPIE